MSETCWTHKKWNKIASVIKLVFYSSIITMMYVSINIRCISCVWFVLNHSSVVMWSTQFDIRSVLIILLGIYHFHQLLPVSQWTLTSNSSPDCIINQNTQILIQLQAERFKIVNTTPSISPRVVRTTLILAVRPLLYVTRWRSWLRHCATSPKVAGSIDIILLPTL